MKVLLTATVQSHICQFHRSLVKVLHAHGCEVHVAARDNLAEKNGLTLDFADRVYDVPFSRSPKSPDNLRAYRQLREIIASEHYDVIHCNTPMGGAVTRLAARTARRDGTKVFYTAHGFHFYRGAPVKNWILYYPIEKWLSRFSDQIITIAQEDFELVRDKFHCRVGHIHGVGVDETRYFPVGRSEKRQLREEMGFLPDRKIILCIGELLPNKNQIMAIRSMESVVKYFPDALLLLAGNGPEEGRLRQAIQSAHLQDHVRMLGYCTHLQDYQHIADVLAACSKREGLGLNVIEAMMAGNPVVATANRGHRELIHEGQNGYLVAVDDVNAMSRRLVELLSDGEKRERMGKTAAISAARYGASRVERELEELYFPECCVKGPDS